MKNSLEFLFETLDMFWNPVWKNRNWEAMKWFKENTNELDCLTKAKLWLFATLAICLGCMILLANKEILENGYHWAVAENRLGLFRLFGMVKDLVTNG